MVQGSENYDLFADSLAGVFTEVNSLIVAKEVLVEEKMVQLHFVLGSDYKVLY